jgi:hypothetical protein
MFVLSDLELIITRKTMKEKKKEETGRKRERRRKGKGWMFR